MITASHHGWPFDGFWEWGLIGGLFGLVMLAFWVVVIVLLVRLIGSRATGRGSHASSALKILEERYARGEIGREEFLERRELLRRED